MTNMFMIIWGGGPTQTPSLSDGSKWMENKEIIQARCLLEWISMQRVFFPIMDWYHTFKSLPLSPTLSVFAVEKNPCQTNPCLHGGSCLQEGDGYSCYCPQGFSGESCEIGESLPGQQCAGKPPRLAAVCCLVTVSWGAATGAYAAGRHLVHVLVFTMELSEKHQHANVLWAKRSFSAMSTSGWGALAAINRKYAEAKCAQMCCQSFFSALLSWSRVYPHTCSRYRLSRGIKGVYPWKDHTLGGRGHEKMNLIINRLWSFYPAVHIMQHQGLSLH